MQAENLQEMPAPVLGGELWLGFIFILKKKLFLVLYIFIKNRGGSARCRSWREELSFFFNGATNGFTREKIAKNQKNSPGLIFAQFYPCWLPGRKISRFLVPEGLTNPQELLLKYSYFMCSESWGYRIVWFLKDFTLPWVGEVENSFFP